MIGAGWDEEAGDGSGPGHQKCLVESQVAISPPTGVE